MNLEQARIDEIRSCKTAMQKAEHDGEKLMKDYVEEYMDEGKLQFDLRFGYFSITVRGMKIENIWRSDNINSIKFIGCPTEIPDTIEKMQKLFEDTRVATRCARQAYLAFRYITKGM